MDVLISEECIESKPRYSKIVQVRKINVWFYTFKTATEYE